MKIHLPLLLVILFMASALMAQDCTREMLAIKPGTWKPGIKGSVSNISPADLLRERAVLANIHKMISTAYNPVGCQIIYSNSLSGANEGAGKNWVADLFSYNMYILRYLCNQNSTDKSKYYVDISTPTTVTISANVIWSLNNLYAADLPDDDFRGYLKLPLKPRLKNGYYYLGSEVVGDRGQEHEIKEYRWLITYDNKLPFEYISRKEYLIIQKKRLEETIRLNGSSDYYIKFMNNITSSLNQPDTENAIPAICMWNDEELFTGFVAEGTAGSFIAVKPNPDYYIKNLPRSAPQFFYVVYKIAHNDPVFEENVAGIREAIDFKQLREMLGK